MKAKIVSIAAGSALNHAGYVRAVALVPDIIDESNWHLAHFPKKAVTPEEVRLASNIRTAARKSQIDEQKMRNHAKKVAGNDEGAADEDEETDEGTNVSGDENTEADEDTDPNADDYKARASIPIDPKIDSRVSEVMKELGKGGSWR